MQHTLLHAQGDDHCDMCTCFRLWIGPKTTCCVESTGLCKGLFHFDVTAFCLHRLKTLPCLIWRSSLHCKSPWTVCRLSSNIHWGQLNCSLCMHTSSHTSLALQGAPSVRQTVVSTSTGQNRRGGEDTLPGWKAHSAGQVVCGCCWAGTIFLESFPLHPCNALFHFIVLCKLQWQQDLIAFPPL